MRARQLMAQIYASRESEPQDLRRILSTFEFLSVSSSQLAKAMIDRFRSPSCSSTPLPHPLQDPKEAPDDLYRKLRPFLRESG